MRDLNRCGRGEHTSSVGISRLVCACYKLRVTEIGDDL